jgi:hypothetical protein
LLHARSFAPCRSRTLAAALGALRNRTESTMDAPPPPPLILIKMAARFSR